MSIIQLSQGPVLLAYRRTVMAPNNPCNRIIRQNNLSHASFNKLEKNTDTTRKFKVVETNGDVG